MSLNKYFTFETFLFRNFLFFTLKWCSITSSFCFVVINENNTNWRKHTENLSHSNVLELVVALLQTHTNIQTHFSRILCFCTVYFPLYLLYSPEKLVWMERADIHLDNVFHLLYNILPVYNRRKVKHVFYVSSRLKGWNIIRSILRVL